jgi:hypothetical protein
MTPQKLENHSKSTAAAAIFREIRRFQAVILFLSKHSIGKIFQARRDLAPGWSPKEFDLVPSVSD